jgi:triosephosphate isomerase
MLPIFIANWKMQLGFSESIERFKEIERGIPATGFQGDIVVCPSFPMIPALSAIARKVRIGAQDCFWEECGAFTGEVSPQLLSELGCEFVIVGHSERREHLQETDAMVANKLHTALAGGLIPILCIGESAEQRRRGMRDHVLMRQLSGALEGLKFRGRKARIVIAYEPVWVIGRGQAVAPSDIRHARDVIETWLHEHYSREKLERNFRIIYGGSVDETNIAEILKKSGMVGSLVGGASLRSQSVLAMLRVLA